MMKRRSTVARVSALTLAVALGWTLTAQAQTADQSTAQNGAASDQLQEVVVTAERRSVNIQQTPIVIQAISQQTLSEEHLTVPQDLEGTVPGLEVTSAGGYVLSPNIRGIGTFVGAQTMQVGTFYDGVLQGIVIGQDMPMFDLADVEVLEGPQGTLVGGNAEAGAMLFTSANPNFNGVNGYVLGKYGNYDDRLVQGAINMPLSDTFALRLSFSTERRGSFSTDIGSSLNGYYFSSYSFTNPAADGAPLPLLQGSVGYGPLDDPAHVDAQSERVKALWKPTDNFQALAEIWVGQNETGGEAAEPNPATYQTLFAAGPTTLGVANAGCSYQPAGTNYAGATGNQLVCPNAGGTSHATYYYPGEQPYVLDYYDSYKYAYNDFYSQYSVEMRYTLPDGIVLRSLSALGHLTTLDDGGLSNGPENAGQIYHPNGPNNDEPEEEINIISPTNGKVSWIAGLFWEYRDVPLPADETIVTAPYQPLQLPLEYVAAGSGQVLRTGAVFGNIDWQFTRTLQLQLGFRENWDANFTTTPFPVVAAAPGTVLPQPNGLGVYLINYPAGCSALAGQCNPVSYRVVSPSFASAHYTDKAPTGKIDLNWTPAPGQNLYVFFARGYKSGGVNSGSTDHPFFNNEDVNDWEAGWKGNVLDGHLVTQIGAYYEAYQGDQVSVFDPIALNDTTTGAYEANLPTTTIYGLSVAVQSRFAGLGINLNYDYNHSALGGITVVNNSQFPAGFSGANMPQCLAGHTYTAPVACFNYVPYSTNVSGETLPNGPVNSGKLSVDYLLHVGTGTVDPKVEWSHTDKAYVSIFHTALNEVSQRNLLNASIDYAKGNMDFQLYGSNITNNTYIYDAGPAVYYGARRQYGVQAKVTF
jgi:iron complex outermembrane recepter protein